MKKFLKDEPRTKKLWKPPSFEDFEVPTKKIKLDHPDKEVKSIEFTNNNPKTIEELTVHPKKIEEVQNWIKSVGRKDVPLLLLLSGPTGCGKTTALRVVSETNGFVIREWINPVDKTNYNSSSLLDINIYDSSSFVDSNQYDKFRSFMISAARYPSILTEDKSSRTLILVKDFPNNFYLNPSIFHKFLMDFKLKCRCPTVFICTDEQRFAYLSDLFPANIIERFNITHIKFNPLSNTLIKKALNNKIKEMNKKNISKNEIETICLNACGDIRSALSNIQFLTTENKNKENNLVKDETLDIFRLLGRILYPKRIGDENIKTKINTDNPNQKFVYKITELSEKVAEHKNADLILHENYFDTFENLNDILKAADVFSLADMFDNKFHPVFDEYKSIVLTTGLMLSNTKSKRVFKQLRRSNMAQINKNLKSQVQNRFIKYSKIGAPTSDCLNLDYIPSLKYIHRFASILDYESLTRFEPRDRRSKLVDVKARSQESKSVVESKPDDDDDDGDYTIDDSD